MLSPTAGGGEATRRAPSQPLQRSQQVLHLHLFSQTQTSQEMLVPTQARQSCPPSPLGIDQDLSSLQVNPGRTRCWKPICVSAGLKASLTGGTEISYLKK